MSANPAQVPRTDQSSSMNDNALPFPTQKSSSNNAQSISELSLAVNSSQPPNIVHKKSSMNDSTSNVNLGRQPYMADHTSMPEAGPSSRPSPALTANQKSSLSPLAGTKQKPIVIEEKEEGEISDDEVVETDPVPEPKRSVPQQPAPPPSTVFPQPAIPPSPPQRAIPSHPRGQHSQNRIAPPSTFLNTHNRPLSKTQRKKMERRAKAEMNAQRRQNSPYNQTPYRQYGQQSASTSPASTPHNVAPPAIEGKGQGKEKEREDEEAEVSLELNDTVAPAATNMSPEEVEQYIDIIRNLISEGVSPDTLVQRGASPEYVMKVCQEIVEGTKNRKALWLETREQPRAESEAPSLPPAEPGYKSPSPEVEVVTVNQSGRSGLERIKSDDSNDSNLYSSIERMDKLQNGFAPKAIAKPTQPIRIESYKPGQPSRPLSQPFTYSTIPTEPTHRSKKRQRDSALAVGSDVVLNYDDAATHPAQPAQPAQPKLPPSGARLGTSNPFSVLDTIPLTPPFSPPSIVKAMVQADIPPEPTAPPPPAPPPLTAEQTLQNTLLESRRKAMDSMRRRRAAVPKPISSVQSITQVEVSEESTPVVDDQAVELQKSIEEQMASIEKEVLEAAAATIENNPIVPEPEPEQNEDEEEQMDLDEPEEGEIIPPLIDSSIPEPVIPPFIGSTSLPVRPPRGIKRMHAEDLNENKATSLPSRSLPPAKRKPFGATQRAQRLVLHLDDSDSESSDDEDTPTPNVIFTPTGDVDIIERQRMLEEKEASIRKLKEQIAARMAARKKKVDDNVAGGTPMEKTASQDTASQVVRNALQPVEGENGSISPIPADVRQLTKELVQAEAEVEAMDIDPVPESIKGENREMTFEAEPNDDKRRLRSISPSVIQTNVQEAVLNVPSQASTSKFTNYQPLLNRYPQLNNTTVDSSLLPFIQIDTTSSQHDSPNLIDTERLFGHIDRRLLNSIILTRLLQANPSMIACQAEMGGGTCADRTCKDLHLDKGIIPTDDDLVEYIGQTLSSQGGQYNDNVNIRNAFIEAKEELRRNGPVNLEPDQGIIALMKKVGRNLKHNI
ncbi:uncharacterized protein L199_002918 [Kwoniella botswanensis]|uniref:uncharacterized protein n=1 Tax=Kwoniella botswanensis TaxID=1268659 RepID=UPI00315D708D